MMIWQWRRWMIVGTLVLLCLSSWSQPAAAFSSRMVPLASLHTYHERPGQTTFRSRQSFRDRTDLAWQTILFKRYDGSTLQGLYLRVVGFPGAVDIDPDRPLKILTGTTRQWQAQPELDPQTVGLPSSAAQYDVEPVLQELTQDIPLELAIPLNPSRTAQVVIPPYGVKEWRQLFAQQIAP